MDDLFNTSLLPVRASGFVSPTVTAQTDVDLSLDPPSHSR
jgi:hypothetical protein